MLSLLSLVSVFFKAFQKYVESRMAKAKRDAMQEEEVEEETLPDEIRYRDQLTGAF